MWTLMATLGCIWFRYVWRSLKTSFHEIESTAHINYDRNHAFLLFQMDTYTLMAHYVFSIFNLRNILEGAWRFAKVNRKKFAHFLPRKTFSPRNLHRKVTTLQSKIVKRIHSSKTVHESRDTRQEIEYSVDQSEWRFHGKRTNRNGVSTVKEPIGIAFPQ